MCTIREWSRYRGGVQKVLRVKRKKGGGWRVTGMPDGEPDMEPYETKRQAEEDKRGVERFFRNESRRSFFTCERKRKKSTTETRRARR